MLLRSRKDLLRRHRRGHQGRPPFFPSPVGCFRAHSRALTLTLDNHRSRNPRSGSPQPRDDHSGGPRRRKSIWKFRISENMRSRVGGLTRHPGLDPRSIIRKLGSNTLGIPDLSHYPLDRRDDQQRQTVEYIIGGGR